MLLDDLLGFPLAEAEQRLRQAGLGYQVEVSKAPRAPEPHDRNLLRVVRVRELGDLVLLTAMQPPFLELPK